MKVLMSVALGNLVAVAVVYDIHRCEPSGLNRQSGDRRQTVALAVALGSKFVIILDEPKAFLGVKEYCRFLALILDVRSRGIPIILVSQNLPHVFNFADRIHVDRLGERLCMIDPKNYTMSDAAAVTTGAKEAPA